MHQFIPSRENELRVHGVVCLDKSPVPSRSDGTWEQPAGIVGRNAVSQKHVILTMHVERLDVEVLDEPPSVGAYPGEALVSFCFDWRSVAGQVEGWRLAKVAVRANSLHAQPFDRES